MKSSLNTLMHEIEIFDPESGSFPASEEERCIVKIQLLAAQIIVDDVCKIKEVSPNLSNNEIIDQLLHNWTENIRDFSSTLVESRCGKFPVSIAAGDGQECR
ncbi:MAG: hypothetical protein LBJ71_03650 [Holosporaceae bacterium]|nr:hypothetical protein [Holosporaceae bacterium]